MKRFAEALCIALILCASWSCAAWAASASTPGANLTEEARPDRSFLYRYNNIINNAAVPGTLPGSADSSINYPCAGASRITLRLYAVASDSASAGVVMWQLLFIQPRFGDGVTNDSTGALPPFRKVTSGVADTVSIQSQPGNGATFDFTRYAIKGETVVKVPPLATTSTYGTNGQLYGSIDFAVPVGAQYVSFRLRPGMMAYLSNGATATRASAFGASGQKMLYRIDYFAGR
jgi:hypothetical protein